MHVTTTKAVQVWASPDGTRKIWDVGLKDSDGRDYPLQTFSEKIAVVGWQGDVETYVGNKGQRFARQKPKEQAPTLMGTSAPQSQAAPQREWVDHGDDIKAQFAIKQAAIIEWQIYINDAGKYAPKHPFSMDAVESRAQLLYAMVDRVKSPQTSKTVSKSEDDDFASLARGIMADDAVYSDGLEDVDVTQIPF